MNPRWVLFVAVGALAGSTLLTGCGKTTGSCSGSVTYEGSPVDNGYITFTPLDDNGQAAGKGQSGGGPITGGRYSVTGLSPAPQVLVKVIGVKKVNFASTSDEMRRRSEEARDTGDNDGLLDPADTIADDAIGNNVKIEIKAGDNPLDFDLKKPATNN